MVIGLGRYVYQLNILCLPSAVCIFIWILADQIAVKISNPRLKFLKERLPSSYQSKLIKLLRVIAQRSTVRYCLLNYHATLIGAIVAFSADINSCPPPPSRDFSYCWLRHLLWNSPNMNVTGLHWWSVNIGSGNGLVPSGNRSLSEPMLTQISVTIWCH